MYSLAEQTLSAIPLIQAFGREHHENEHFRGLSQRTMRANLRYEWAGHQFKVATATVTTIATACVIVYGGLAVQNGTVTIGGLLVLMAYFAALYSPLETLAYLAEGFASAKAGACRVLQILDEEIRPLAILRMPDRLNLTTHREEPRSGSPMLALAICHAARSCMASHLRLMRARWWRLLEKREPVKARSCRCCYVFLNRGAATFTSETLISVRSRSPVSATTSPSCRNAHFFCPYPLLRILPTAVPLPREGN